MVKGWTVNGSYTASVARTRTFAYKELEGSNTFEVTFQLITYFTVRFADNINATADGTDIASDDSVAAGSRMVFTYAISVDTVTRWLNNGTAYPAHTEQLVIEALSGSLDISVETGELPFYEVRDETDGTLTGDSTAQTDADGRLTVLPSDPARNGYRLLKSRSPVSFTGLRLFSILGFTVLCQ